MTGPPRYKMSLTNLAGTPDFQNFGSMFVSETDKYGITQLEFTDPGGLAAYLEKAGIDHLVLCNNLLVSRQDEAQGVCALPGPGGTTTVMGGGNSKFSSLFGQVIIWDRATEAVVWNGYVQGKQPIFRNFTKNTVKGMAEEFYIDLATVLR